MGLSGVIPNGRQLLSILPGMAAAISANLVLFYLASPHILIDHLPGEGLGIGDPATILILIVFVIINAFLSYHLVEMLPLTYSFDLELAKKPILMAIPSTSGDGSSLSTRQFGIKLYSILYPKRFLGKKFGYINENSPKGDFILLNGHSQSDFIYAWRATTLLITGMGMFIGLALMLAAMLSVLTLSFIIHGMIQAIFAILAIALGACIGGAFCAHLPVYDALAKAKIKLDDGTDITRELMRNSNKAYPKVRFFLPTTD